MKTLQGCSRSFFTMAFLFLSVIHSCGNPEFSVRSDGNSLSHGAKPPVLQLRKWGSFDVPFPAFLSLETLEKGGDKSLVITSFGKGDADAIRYVSDLPQLLKEPVKAKLQTITQKIIWPNEARMAPTSAFNRDVMAVAGGFLVPGKTGGITLLDHPALGPVPTVKITNDKFAGPYGWFYHHIHWKDMNGDGLLDILTARANAPLLKLPFEFPWLPVLPAGELLWLEQPASLPFQSPWKEHVLVKGPDVNFEVVDLDSDGSDEILVAQFFTKKLSLLWEKDGKFHSKVIDENMGPVFDLQVTESGIPGQKMLIATNHVSDSTAGVFAFEIPSDYRNGIWKKHVLLDGIPTTQPGKNQASPGRAIAFFPHTHYKGKTSIVVSGDGAQRIYILKPVNNDPQNWKYTVEEPLAQLFGDEAKPQNLKSVIGGLAVGDVNGDGAVEIFVPAYHAHKIYILGF